MKNHFDQVLLVDDDEITCFLHKLLVEGMAVAEQVDVATDGLKALQYVKEHWQINPPMSGSEHNIIFLDINMPRMDGFEFLEEFEKITLDTDVLVVMLTSSVSEKDFQRAKAHKIYAYLEKPLTQEKISHLITNLSS